MIGTLSRPEETDQGQIDAGQKEKNSLVAGILNLLPRLLTIYLRVAADIGDGLGPRLWPKGMRVQ